MKKTLGIITIAAALVGLGYFALVHNNNPTSHGYDLGLDLAGGTQLTYEADVSEIEAIDVAGSVSALRTVLERRLNALGSSDIKVTTESASVFSQDSEDHYRVIVEIPGVFDSTQAQSLIGKIPVLDFRLERNLQEINNEIEQITKEQNITPEEALKNLDPVSLYQTTGLSGRYIQNAVLSSNPNTGQATVLIQFDQTGKEIFADLTKNNINKAMAIVLDGEVISAPVIRTAIVDGNAEISGQFTVPEAAELVRNLKFGALPVPIELLSTQSISPTLGTDIIEKGINAGLLTMIAISGIMIFLYRIGGVLATIALSLYLLLLLSYFKLTGTDMTAAGIAGFIITIGMAVDANILIFERIKEELRTDKSIDQSIRDGFARAWLSIRDGNVSSIIVALVLYFLTSSFVKGFALSFGVGIILSMFTAITITRSLLLLAASEKKWVRNHLLGNIL